MKTNLIVLLTLVLCPILSGGGDFTEPRLSSYRLKNPSPAAMQKIAEQFEVTRKLSDGFEIIVPAAQQRELLELAPNAELIEADISARVPRMSTRTARLEKIGYHNLTEVQTRLQTLAQTKPEIAQYFQYGVSRQGRPLMGIKLSDNVAVDEDEPEIMLTAATHGDEIITTEILLNLMDQIATSYGTDKRFTQMLDGREIYFIPVVNADGFASRNRYDNGSDPNRSYPYPENVNATPTASIAALIQFFSNHQIAGSIDFHAYGEMIMYPWAYTHSPIPENYGRVFDAIASSMAETNSYTFGPISDVIYVAKGSSADYYFWQKNTRAFAIEVGRSKAPDTREIPSYTAAQAEATWRFIESF